MSALSDALNEANVHQWSSRDIARRSGGKINHATAAKYLNGTHAKRPTEPKLQALADVFSLPVQKLRELANMPAGERTPYQPPAEAARLNERQRRAVNELIRLLADTAQEGGEGHARGPASMNSGDGPQNVTELSARQPKVRDVPEKRVAHRPKGPRRGDDDGE